MSVQNFLLKNLLAHTALGTAVLLAVVVQPAYAACDNNAPGNGGIVTCTAAGTDTIGVQSPSADTVIVRLQSNALVNTTGTAIEIGNNGYVDLMDGARVTSGSGPAIIFNGAGSISTLVTSGTSAAPTVISGDVLFAGTGFASVQLRATTFNVIDFGSTAAIVTIDGSNGNSNGTLIGGSSGSDILNLTGAPGAFFNTNSISGFEVFNKNGAGSWNLTGTNKQDWTVNGGTLAGNVSNLGNVVTSTGTTVQFSQNTNGTHGDVISGAGNLVKLGSGTLTLTNNSNSYSGGTVVVGTNSLISISNDAQLGNTSGNLTLSFDGGISFSSAVTSARNIILDSGNAFFKGTSGALSGIISGAGKLIKTDTGVLTLSGNNTYTGGTEIRGGSATVAVSSDANLGDASGSVTIDSGTLRLGASFNTARNFIFNSIARINTNGFNMILSGNLSGSGQTEVSGNGTLTLAGNSTKTGGFRVSAISTLVGNTNNLIGDIQTGSSAALLRFNQTVAGTYNDIISGPGKLDKTGTGNLILTATHSYTGTTTINAGRLSVNGDISSSSGTTIGTLGTLGGNGTVGTVTNNGTIAPGNSIGTLTAGNTTFNTGSIYEVEVNDALNSDLLAITGTLNINSGSTVSVLPAAGSYAANNLYTIITHTGARTGTFDSVTSSLAFLNASLIYNANDVQLLLTSNGNSFNSVAKDHVQQAVADTITNLGAGNIIYDRFTGLTTSDAQQALDDLSGEHISGITTAMAQSTGIIRTALSSRMQAIAYHNSSGNLSALAPINIASLSQDINLSMMEPAAGGLNTSSLLDTTKRIWVEPFGTDGQTGSRGTAAKQSRGSSGIIAGMERSVSKDLQMGVFAGYETGEVNTYSERASTDVSNYHAGVYSAYQFTEGGLRLAGGIGGTYHDLSSKRYIVFPGLSETLDGDTNGYTATAFIEASQPLTSGDIAIEPFIGVNATYSHMDGYSETGGASALKIDDVNIVTPMHVVGVRAGSVVYTTEEGGDVTLNGSLAWQHAYGGLEDKSSMSFASGSGAFTTYGTGRTRDAAVVGAGFDAPVNDKVTVYGAYDGTLSQNSQDHAVRAGVKYLF